MALALRDLYPVRRSRAWVRKVVSFSSEEVERYGRHLLLKEIGGAGQQRLKAATVTLVGAGGLGAPAAMYLAAAGIGRLRLIDPDAVSLSNLQRQIIFTAAGVTKPKVEEAAAALRALNENVAIEIVDKFVSSDNADSLFRESDLVLDGCDNFETRFVVNDSCLSLGLPLVSGAVGRWDGLLSTFARRPSSFPKNAPAESDEPTPQTGDASDTQTTAKDGHAIAKPSTDSPCYRCLVTEAPEGIETCSTVGVMGPLCGIIGSAMALEAIKLITGAGTNLIGRLAIFDALHWRWRDAKLERAPDCPACARY